MTHDCDVLIVGAGPVGLLLACDLARRGIAARIIDRNAGPTDLSKAIGVHARTLEILQDLDVAERAIERGVIVHGAAFYSGRRHLLEMRFEGLESPYPFMLDLAQGETERLLLERLAELGGTAERKTELLSFEQDDEGVTARLRAPDGSETVCRAAYMAGCDGAHSTVRHALGLDFAGEAYPANMLLADVQVDWDFPRDKLLMGFGASNLLFIAPMQGGRARIIGNLDDGVSEVTEDLVRDYLHNHCPVPARISDPAWLTAFRISERQVAHYGRGRVFLAGDAAHIHSPAGGQGMNTGMQDVYNLGWKLDLVLSGITGPDLLESYHAERHPVGAMVLETTGRMLRMAHIRNPLARFGRNFLMKLVGSHPGAQRRMRAQLSQLAVTYAESALVENAWQAGEQKVKAGDRAPDGPLVDPQGNPTTLFEALRGSNHVVLGFAGRQGDAAVEQCTEAALYLPDTLARAILVQPEDRGWADPGDALHDRYGARDGALFVIRPDGYVGLAARPADMAPLNRYFGRLGSAPQ
jgi:2-polyprenyl-6-methoxyphenol hydroxylase-like FAD-dependent oxidoreductase